MISFITALKNSEKEICGINTVGYQFFHTNERRMIYLCKNI